MPFFAFKLFRKNHRSTIGFPVPLVHSRKENTGETPAPTSSFFMTYHATEVGTRVSLAPSYCAIAHLTTKALPDLDLFSDAGETPANTGCW